MTRRHITNPKTSIAEVIDAAKPDGLVIETEGRPPYALLQLDDDLLDYLLDKNPSLINECCDIRTRMRDGQYQTHEQVRRALKA